MSFGFEYFMFFLVGTISASDIWYSAYEGVGCFTSNLLSQDIISDLNCISYDVDGTTISARVLCDDDTSSSAWSANLYLSDDCSGLTLSGFGADSACACANGDVYGTPLSINVNCAGSAPVCTDDDDTPSEFDIYVAAYLNNNCDTDDYLVGSKAPNGQCVAYGAGSTAVSLSFHCDENDKDSSWTARVFANAGCAGEEVTRTGGDDWDNCASITAFGSSLSFFVNCGGDSKKSYSDSGGDGSSSGGGAVDEVIIAFGILGGLIAIVLLFMFVKPLFTGSNRLFSEGDEKQTELTPTASPFQNDL